MLHGVNVLAFPYVRGGRYADIVCPGSPVVTVSDAVSGAACNCQQLGCRAAVQIDYDRIPVSSHFEECLCLGPTPPRGPIVCFENKRFADGRMLREYRSERRFYEHVKLQFWPPFVQGFDQRQGEDGVAQGSHSNEENSG